MIALTRAGRPGCGNWFRYRAVSPKRERTEKMTGKPLGRSGLTKEMLDDVILRVENHYSAAPTDIAIHGLSEFDEPLPQYGVGVQATIEMLDRVESPATVATAGPRYYGFVIGGTFPVSVASNWLSTACDQCSGSIAMSPLATKVESTAADLRSARDPEFFGGRIRDRIYRCACRLIARRQTKSIRRRPRFHGNIYGHRA